MLASSQASTQALSFYRVPLFLLPIYKAAAVQYGVPWQILAAINEIETDYGTDQSVSSAGAVGWMQFMPETWSSTASTRSTRATPTPTTRSTRCSRPRATCALPAPRRICAARSSPTTTPKNTSTR